MASTDKIIDILNGSDHELKTKLVQPAIAKAVEKGLLPKNAPTDNYLKNWEGIIDVLKTFLETSSNELG